MKLPSLKISLPFIFLCWCIAGIQTHGSVLLAYPAMWAVVGLFFFGLHVLTRAPAKATAAGHASGESTADRVTPAPIRDDSPTDHQISTPV